MYQNLAFSGGGIRGLAYIGAFEALEGKGLTEGIRRVAGTSAGAIMAMLIATGMTSQQMRRLAAGQMGKRWGIGIGIGTRSNSLFLKVARLRFLFG